jgi:hypothetical protein
MLAMHATAESGPGGPERPYRGQSDDPQVSNAIALVEIEILS